MGVYKKGDFTHNTNEASNVQLAEKQQDMVAKPEPANTPVVANASKNAKPQKEKTHGLKHKDVNAGQKSFADGLNAYKIIWVFVFGCVFGVIFETFYVYLTEGEWMRRSGMLYGPFNQIYGMGAVLFTVLLYRMRNKNAFLIFAFSAIIGGAFEYLCSWVQQLAFGSVSWEYSSMKGSIGGRTNILYVFGWGLLGMIFIKHFWPFISELIERIPNELDIKNPGSSKVLRITGKSLSIVVAVFLAADLLLSGAAVYRAGRRAEGAPATNVVAQWLDETYPDEVIAEKYPSMDFVGRLNTSNADLSDDA